MKTVTTLTAAAASAAVASASSTTLSHPSLSTTTTIPSLYDDSTIIKAASTIMIPSTLFTIPRGGGGSGGSSSNHNDNNRNGTDDTPPTNTKETDPATAATAATTTNDKRKKKKKMKTKPSKTFPNNRSTQSNDKESSSGEADDETIPTNDNNNNNNSLPIVQEILQQDDYYQILGLLSSDLASESEITKAYRKRAVQTHPDKTGGDRRAFDKVAEAYGVLSDPIQRQIYNVHGKAGLDHHAARNGGGGGGASTTYQDVLSRMFHSAQSTQRQRNQKNSVPRNPTVRYQLQVTLEDLYQGLTQRVEVTLPRTPFATMAPGTRHSKRVDVHIPRGSFSGQSIVLSGEMDVHPNQVPGDVIFVLTQVPHETFTRKGHDLAMELSITLDEAISGFTKSFQHLDGRQVWMAYPSPKDNNHAVGGKHHGILATGDVHVLKGQGMPKRHQPSAHHDDTDAYGDLYVQYRVELPKSGSISRLNEDERKELSRLLRKLQATKPTNVDVPKEKEMLYLTKAHPTDFGRASGKPTVIEDDDDHHHPNHHMDEDDDFSSFASSFFSSATGGGAGGAGAGSSFSRSFYFGHPFGGGGSSTFDGDDNDGSNIQCQQM